MPNGNGQEWYEWSGQTSITIHNRWQWLRSEGLGNGTSTGRVGWGSTQSNISPWVVTIDVAVVYLTG